jgi:GTP pyrophosphokinase
MPKVEYLKRILEHGSVNAKILKSADRISNLTDLHRAQYSRKVMSEYLDMTEEWVLPMAESVNPDMAIELGDLIRKRREQVNILKYPGLLQL